MNVEQKKIIKEVIDTLVVAESSIGKGYFYTALESITDTREVLKKMLKNDDFELNTFRRSEPKKYDVEPKKYDTDSSGIY